MERGRSPQVGDPAFDLWCVREKLQPDSVNSGGIQLPPSRLLMPAGITAHVLEDGMQGLLAAIPAQGADHEHRKDAALSGLADRGQLRLVASALLAVRQGESALGYLAFSMGSLFFYYLCYRFRLIPRWLSIWALIGAVLFLASSVMPLFGVSTRSTLYIALNAPGGLQEMVLAVWLIVKGFSVAEAG